MFIGLVWLSGVILVWLFSCFVFVLGVYCLIYVVNLGYVNSIVCSILLSFVCGTIILFEFVLRV